MRLEKIIKDVFFRLFCFVLFVFLRRLDRIIRLSDRRWKSPAKSVEWIGASAPEGIFFFPFLLSSSSLLSAFASAFDCRIDRIGESVFTIIFFLILFYRALQSWIVAVAALPDHLMLRWVFQYKGIERVDWIRKAFKG